MYRIATFLVAVALIGSGVSYFVLSNKFTVSDTAVVVYQKPSSDESNSVSITSRQLSKSENPTRIFSEQLNMNVDIALGGKNITTNEWILDSKNAFSTNESATPLIYGHNSDDVFAKLSQAGMGTEFTVQYDGASEKYTYLATRFIDVNDASILSEKSESNIMMLLTCSGPFNELRRIVYVERVA